jgi:hypothetical protein
VVDTAGAGGSVGAACTGIVTGDGEYSSVIFSVVIFLDRIHIDTGSSYVTSDGARSPVMYRSSRGKSLNRTISNISGGKTAEIIFSNEVNKVSFVRASEFAAGRFIHLLSLETVWTLESYS